MRTAYRLLGSVQKFKICVCDIKNAGSRLMVWSLESVIIRIAIPTLDIEQKTQVAPLDVTRNGEYCIYNRNTLYNIKPVVSFPFSVAGAIYG